MSRIYVAFLSLTLLFSSTMTAQIFPYSEAFDTYSAPQALNGNGGIVATSRVMVTANGVVGNCAEFQNIGSATPNMSDTLTSPTIGPLTTNSATSFYFRAVKDSAGVKVRYQMTGGDNVQILVSAGILTYSQYVINNANQNPTNAYVKVVVPVPAFVSSFSGKFKIVSVNSSAHTWQMEFDSLAVRDTLQAPPTITATVINDSCKGDSSGSIRITATGATPPYSYQWSHTAADTSFIDHLAARAYSVTVTDAVGASVTATYTVTEPQFQLLLDSLSKTNERCNAAHMATAAIYARGGTPAYTYRWTTNPVQNTQQAQNLSAGNYSVIVTDSKGCTVSATTQITQPPALTVALSSTASTGSNGTATAIANGGTSPFSYAWSPSGQTTPIATGLAPGKYRVQVTDGNGCILIDSVTLAGPNSIGEVDEKALSIYPNPASDRLYISIADGIQAQAAVTISDISGRVVLSTGLLSEYISISTLTTGLYTVKVINADKTYIRRIVVR